ncbi:hypothetical protein ETD86_30035 [Nonomuraea turkmeniaca]|uniref:Uncharacterized protein n=1 Tax=Nonomuraea turkmeniaca TaxID=103838 RepID=A0A5S4F9S4_9ACTN|nr:hypothetical protein [Nonomuraea turkmeniaca]TMR13806.1 hypothetical protein ETD86_30035 [Nonomuraea turkmeniaca]
MRTVQWRRYGTWFTAGPEVKNASRVPKPGQRYWHGWIPVNGPGKPSDTGTLHPAADAHGRSIGVGAVVTLGSGEYGRVVAVHPHGGQSQATIDVETLQGQERAGEPASMARIFLDAAGRPPGSTRPAPGETSYEEAAATLAADVASGVKFAGAPSAGATALVHRVEFANGGTAYRKRVEDTRWRSARDQADAEELGALVGWAVGARVPAVHRVSEHELFLQEAPDPSALDRPFDEIPALRKAAAATDDGWRIALLDVLIANSDRNDGNWKYADGRVTGIDLGNAKFDPPPPGDGRLLLVRNAFVARLLTDDLTWKDGNELTAAEVAQIRRRLNQVRPRFIELGRADWLGNVMDRLDEAVKHAAERE